MLQILDDEMKGYICLLFCVRFFAVLVHDCLPVNPLNMAGIFSDLASVGTTFGSYVEQPKIP